MTLNDLKIDDVFEYGSYTLKLKHRNELWFICDIIKSDFYTSDKSLLIPTYTSYHNECKLISRNNIQNQIQEIQSLKNELQNIQKKIEKLEEENQLELGGIYEVNDCGKVFKGFVLENRETYYLILDNTGSYKLIHKNNKIIYKKLPDESVKQFFKKDSK